MSHTTTNNSDYELIPSDERGGGSDGSNGSDGSGDGNGNVNGDEDDKITRAGDLGPKADIDESLRVTRQWREGRGYSSFPFDIPTKYLK